MSAEKIFVGRNDELKQFKKVLERPRGEAVLVVGQAGMGKTWLVNEMAGIAESHPELKCGWVRYEVTKEDSVDSRLALMMADAFEAASNPGKFWGGDDRGKRQWLALFKASKAIPGVGNAIDAIRELASSLKFEPSKDTRQQFIEKMKLISGKMPENGRVIFIVDPEKYMQEKSDQSWAIIVRSLPEKIKLVFAQRPEDVLVESETFDELNNVERIPEKRLSVLEKKAVEELLGLRAGEVGHTVKQLDKVLGRYKGHPYALGAALDLVAAGTKLEELPRKPEPTKFAEVQWKKVCKSGDDAIKLFKAYAVLEVGVPDGVVEVVSGLDSDARQHLLADKYLGGLLREEGEGRRIYHAILADHILGQIGEDENKEYHKRAVEVYREKLSAAKKAQSKPDALAAMRLAEHVLASEGPEAFVYAVLNESGKLLKNLGLLDAVESSLLRALRIVKADSREEAAVLGNLGLIYGTRGDLDKAEEMHKKSLEISEKLGRLEGTANQCGNLGLIYMARGELDKAEEMHKKALEIAEEIGHQEIMASEYGNLGLIYRKRGELDKAEEMFRSGLKIDEKLGRLEGMAAKYGNLGLIYGTRGELDKAEEMFYKILEIHKQIGSKEGMANDYGNLGVIYEERGDIKKAREYWEKARDLYERIGMPHKVEKVQGWIDGVGKD